MAKQKQAGAGIGREFFSTCKEAGINPEKPFKGSFNVRIPPTLHQKAALLTMEEKMTLNKFVKESIREKVSRESDTNEYQNEIKQKK